MSKTLEVPYDWADDVAMMLSRLAFYQPDARGDDLIENAIPTLMSAHWSGDPTVLLVGVVVPDGLEVRMGPDPTPGTHLNVGRAGVGTAEEIGWAFTAPNHRIEP